MQEGRVIRRSLKSTVKLGSMIAACAVATTTFVHRAGTVPTMPVLKAAALSKNEAYFKRHDSRHEHMINWALEPTGIEGVSPLDPASIPKWVNQLSTPPVHVPVGTGRDPLTGRTIPRYEV